MIVFVLIGLHLVFVVFLLTMRFWIHHLDKEHLHGSDLHMAKWAIENGKRAYSAFHLKFSLANDFTQSTADMIDNIRRDMTSPKSNYRRDVDLTKLRFVERQSIVPEDVFEIYEAPNDNQFFAIRDEKQRPLIIRFDVQRKIICVIFDHTVWDGIRVVNETMVPLIQCQEFDSRWLIRPKYTPVLSELLQMYALYAMSLRWVTHRPLKTLTSAQQRVYKHRLAVQDVKDLKNRHSAKFSSALLAVWARKLFEWAIPARTKLRFGIIIGFKADRFRNNYSILTIDVKRSWTLDETVQAVERQMSFRKIEILPLFELINNIEIQTFFKSSMIDVLFSPAFFDTGTGASEHLSDMAMVNLPSSCPVYTFGCSIGENIQISTTRNTPELLEERMAEDAEEIFQFHDDHTVEPIRLRTPENQY